MERRVDLVLMLLFAKGPSGSLAEPIVGITRLTKLLFLLEKESGIDDDFEFVPYKMGPYSSEINPVLEFLTTFPSPDAPLVTGTSEGNEGNNSPELSQYIKDIASTEDSSQQISNETNKAFKLTDKGFRVAEHVWNDLTDIERDSFEAIKQKYGKLSLKQLLKYVYAQYPDMTGNSEILDYVNGK